jgi:hypothetical protein
MAFASRSRSLSGDLAPCATTARDVPRNEGLRALGADS